MDRVRQKGILNKAKGALKKGLGRVTGDRKTLAEGHTDTAKGEVQNVVGGVKDRIRKEP